MTWDRQRPSCVANWPTPIPSYELSGVVATADDVAEVSVGDEVYALTPFDRDGVAAEYAAVPAPLLAPRPASLSHVESAAVPLPALSAWQGLFVHGRLAAAERVLIHGALGAGSRSSGHSSSSRVMAAACTSTNTSPARSGGVSIFSWRSPSTPGACNRVLKSLLIELERAEPRS
jgi:hypothetical protein